MNIVTVLVAVAMAIGLAGVMIPFVPGLTLVWAAALVFGLAEGFGTVGWISFGVISVLALAGIAAGYVLPGKAAGDAGADGLSIAIGAVCAIVGFFAIPVVGLVLGGVLGIFVSEYVRTDLDHARRATWATLVGFGIGAIAQLVAGIFMVFTWVVWLIVG